MSQVEQSPALQLVLHVWRNTKERSWIHLNHTMQDALALAIKAGLRFEPGDFETIIRETRGSRWFGEETETWVYGGAVQWGNISACVAWERYRERKPFILCGRRLHVGAMVEPEYLGRDEINTGVVTSFSSDGESVTICTYPRVYPPIRKGDHVQRGGLPIRRIKLTVSEVRELEKQRKAAKSA